MRASLFAAIGVWLALPSSSSSMGWCSPWRATSGCGGRASSAETGAPPTGSTPVGQRDGAPASDGPPALYAANATAGGYDHVEVWKIDRAHTRCVHLHFVHPEAREPGAPFSGVTTPAEWILREADRSEDITTCKPRAERSSVSATAAAGTVTWPSPTNGALPCRLSAHVRVSFADEPRTEDVDVDELGVDGAC